jgi:hypothetical protein
VNGPDVLWDGVPHQTIVEWVSRGPGAALTEQMEARLKSAAEALDHTSNLVNAAIQRAGGDWQGSTANAATEAMRVLRGFDDGMHFTSNIAGIRAFGQSDGAGFARANVPPVVDVNPPNPTGGLFDILKSTVDFQKQQAAAKEAEERAREVMRQYSKATQERVASMTPLTPAPQVVLEVSPPPRPPTPPPPPPVVEPPRPRDPGNGPHQGGSVQGPDGGAGPGQAGPTPPSATPGRTQPAVAPAQGSRPVTSGSPTDPILAPGGSGATAPPPAGGFAGRAPGGSSNLPPRSDPRGRGGEIPDGGRGRSGRAPGGAAPAGRGAAPMARGAGAGIGGESPFGAGPGARREEDREHQVKYGVPTAEHFEPDDLALDPHQAGWYVAPQVIGDSDEEDDHR